MPFDVTAAVVLPNHIHFLWTLPDGNYSKRVGRLKVLFTRILRGSGALPQDVCLSRQRQRESDVWQRRFWEHTIRDEADWVGHLNYLHYNPVKHGLVRCSHEWEYSSFRWFVGEGMYAEDWG
ncbi:transposase, partial [Nodosilinea sp. LEGE 07088]|uniref:REP-associated tyrosine transposase n=1 Tax=Nodosilinea sp. LEGE 07088 TaxID=2777968 RepID=UPI001D15449C